MISLPPQQHRRQLCNRTDNLSPHHNHTEALRYDTQVDVISKSISRVQKLTDDHPRQESKQYMSITTQIHSTEQISKTTIDKDL